MSCTQSHLFAVVTITMLNSAKKYKLHFSTILIYIFQTTNISNHLRVLRIPFLRPVPTLRSRLLPFCPALAWPSWGRRCARRWWPFACWSGPSSCPRARTWWSRNPCALSSSCRAASRILWFCQTETLKKEFKF